MPDILEERHTLLAYKLPDDQDPQVVNDIFDTNSDELVARCKSLERPKWLTKEVKATKISLESFPHKVS